MPSSFPNEFLAHVFYHLARSAYTMHQGPYNDLRNPESHLPEAEVLHLDMKLSNTLLDVADPDSCYPEYPTVKVADFGLGGLTRDPNERNPAAFMFKGTPEYMAPEQLCHFSQSWNFPIDSVLQRPEMNEKTNVWGVGVIMCLLMTLESRESFHDSLRNLKEQDYYTTYNEHFKNDFGTDPRYSHYNPALRHLIWQCIRPDPTLRPSAHHILLRTRQYLRALHTANTQSDIPRPINPVYLRWSAANMETYWAYTRDTDDPIFRRNHDALRPEHRSINQLQREYRRLESLVRLRETHLQDVNNDSDPATQRTNRIAHARLDGAIRRRNRQASNVWERLNAQWRREDQRQILKDMNRPADKLRWYAKDVWKLSSVQARAAEDPNHHDRFIPGSLPVPTHDANGNRTDDAKIRMDGDRMRIIDRDVDYGGADDDLAPPSDPDVTIRDRKFGNGPRYTVAVAWPYDGYDRDRYPPALRTFDGQIRWTPRPPPPPPRARPGPPPSRQDESSGERTEEQEPESIKKEDEQEEIEDYDPGDEADLPSHEGQYHRPRAPPPTGDEGTLTEEDNNGDRSLAGLLQAAVARLRPSQIARNAVAAMGRMVATSPVEDGGQSGSQRQQSRTSAQNNQAMRDALDDMF